MQKPKFVYILTIFLEHYIFICEFDQVLPAQSQIFLNIVVKKGMALTYIMSIVNVISLYCLGMSIGWTVDTRIVFSSSFSFQGTYIRTMYGFCSNFVFLLRWDSF